MIHGKVKGIISMRPGHNAGATCFCGWHSHTRTIEDHIEEVEGPDLGAVIYVSTPDQIPHWFNPEIDEVRFVTEEVEGGDGNPGSSPDTSQGP